MINLQQLIDRYKNVPKPSHSPTVFGYLSLGSKEYYTINSDQPIKLNKHSSSEKFRGSDSDGFVVNSEGKVEEYVINDNVPSINWYYDEECTQPIDIMETNYSGLYNKHNEDRIVRSYNHTISEYYLHPYFPDKQIKAFEVIRIMPFFTLGKVYTVRLHPVNFGLIKNEYNQKWYIDECLEYPEFFKPLY